MTAARPCPASFSLQLGVITVGLTLLAPLLGVSSFRKLGVVTKFPEAWQPRIKWLHRMVGAAGQGSAGRGGAG